MSIHFHPLVIKDIRKETADCVSVSFHVPEHLKKQFAYKQGQNLTIRAILNNEEVRRTYSLCSSPLENEWCIAIKKVNGGLFSTYANEQLKKGDILDVMEPAGRFYTELNPANKKHYVAFAAGSGITPVISIIKTTLATELKSHFTLVYGNRNRHSIIFFEELQGLKNRYMQRFNLIHILSREKTETAINSGRITEDKLNDLAPLIHYDNVDEFFLCGPEQMIFCIKEYLEAQGIHKNKIHFELFTVSGAKVKGTGKKEQDATVKAPQSNITVKADGRTFEFNLPLYDDTSILDAALQQGADLPYACKGGMCCSCKARLLEGEVEMDVHWGLEHDEIEKGFILTCQSHPKSQKIVIDFDIK